jgi:hypothetical protein
MSITLFEVIQRVQWNGSRLIRRKVINLARGYF